MQVRISKGLLREVHGYVVRCRDAEINAVLPTRADTSRKVDLYQFDGDDVETLLYSEAPHLRGQLPDAWTTEPGTIKLRLFESETPYASDKRPQAVTEEEYVAHLCGIRCTRRVSSPLRQSYLTFYVSTAHPSVRGVLGLVRQTVSDHAKAKELIAKWDGVYVQVKEFLSSHKSLNAALKAWPGLEHYIPAKYIDRVNAKIERSVRQSDEDAATVDTRHLEAVAVTAKLIGGA